MPAPVLGETASSMPPCSSDVATWITTTGRAVTREVLAVGTGRPWGARAPDVGRESSAKARMDLSSRRPVAVRFLSLLVTVRWLLAPARCSGRCPAAGRSVPRLRAGLRSSSADRPARPMRGPAGRALATSVASRRRVAAPGGARPPLCPRAGSIEPTRPAQPGIDTPRHAGRSRRPLHWTGDSIAFAAPTRFDLLPAVCVSGSMLLPRSRGPAPTTRRGPAPKTRRGARRPSYVAGPVSPRSPDPSLRRLRQCPRLCSQCPLQFMVVCQMGTVAPGSHQHHSCAFLLAFCSRRPRG